MGLGVHMQEGLDGQVAVARAHRGRHVADNVHHLGVGPVVQHRLRAARSCTRLAIEASN